MRSWVILTTNERARSPPLSLSPSLKQLESVMVDGRRVTCGDHEESLLSSMPFVVIVHFSPSFLGFSFFLFALYIQITIPTSRIKYYYILTITVYPCKVSGGGMAWHGLDHDGMNWGMKWS